MMKKKGKKITVYLTEEAEQQLYEVMYSLDNGSGSCTQSEAVSHCMAECFLFERIVDDQITNWLNVEYPGKIKAELKKFSDNRKKKIQ